MRHAVFSMEGLLDIPVPLPEDPSTWQTNTPYLVGEPSVTVVLEYLKGEVRRKVRADGSEVSNVMPTAYGRIMRTTDIHGEELDIYINQIDYKPDAMVYIIDQVGLTGLFDEHKVMAGFRSVQDAEKIYLSVVKPGIAPVKVGAISSMSQQEFYEWSLRSDKTKSPASFDTELGSVIVKRTQILTKMSATPTVTKTTAKQVPGGVEITLGLPEKGPTIVTKANGDTGYHHTCHIYGAVDHKTWWKFLDQVVRLLDTATRDDTFKFLISSPGGSVPTVGPLLAAMETTVAATETVAVGPVASAAVFVWAWGKRRKIEPNAYFMQHSTFQIICGKTQYIQSLTGFTDQYARQMLMRLVGIKMFTEEEVENMLSVGADVFITADDMIKRVGAVSGEGNAHD